VAQDQKGAAAGSAWLVVFDESAVSLIPPVRRTWSPRGHTPTLRHRSGWKKASMAAALGSRPDGTAARLCFHLQQPSYNTDRLIGVLEQLAGFYAGHSVVLRQLPAVLGSERVAVLADQARLRFHAAA
jgi:hypothetical protein